jgi:23S rRNA (cytosine1962-C5)-methyltransferase
MRIVVASRAAAAVRRGHPWIYLDAVVRPPRGLASGDVVDAYDEAGVFLGRGLWEAGSPIAVRVHERDAEARLDAASMVRRVEAALVVRDRLFAGGDTTAYRLCHGEGDRVPGLVIDRYDDVAVLRLDGEALAPWVERLVEPLAARLGARGVRSLALRRARGDEGPKLRALRGPEPPARIVVRERGMAMEVDLAEGQKTGAFLDQRENRARVRALAGGRARALNLFSYAGGFSIAAALGGAGRVTSVDVAAAAHATAQRTFRANGVDPGAHAFVTADAFVLLERERERGARYDLVISDPPSFAPSERAKTRALAAYRKLHAAAAAVLAEGGVLCASSCSSHVSLEELAATLDDATLGRSDLRLAEAFGPPMDHPSLPVFPEGRYLKLIVMM